MTAQCEGGLHCLATMMEVSNVKFSCMDLV